MPVHAMYAFGTCMIPQATGAGLTHGKRGKLAARGRFRDVDTAMQQPLHPVLAVPYANAFVASVDLCLRCDTSRGPASAGALVPPAYNDDIGTEPCVFVQHDSQLNSTMCCISIPHSKQSP